MHGWRGPRGCGPPEGGAKAWVSAANLLISLGRLDEAERALRGQEAAATRTGSLDDRLEGMWLAGRIALGGRDLDAAEDAFQQLVSLAGARANRVWRLEGALGLALVAARRGDVEGVRTFVADAVAIGVTYGDAKRALARSLVVLALDDDPALAVRLLAYARKGRPAPSTGDPEEDAVRAAGAGDAFDAALADGHRGFEPAELDAVVRHLL